MFTSTVQEVNITVDPPWAGGRVLECAQVVVMIFHDRYLCLKPDLQD